MALLAAMLCCMVSSVLVSGKVFAFMNLGGSKRGEINEKRCGATIR